MDYILIMLPWLSSFLGVNMYCCFLLPTFWRRPQRSAPRIYVDPIHPKGTLPLANTKGTNICSPQVAISPFEVSGSIEERSLEACARTRYKCICTHMYESLSLYIYTYIHMCIYMYTKLPLYLYVHVYIYIYICL